MQIETLELGLIGKEGVVQPGGGRGAEQGDVTALDQALIHQLVELHAIVHVAHPVVLDAAIVFEHQQGFNLQVPQRIEDGGGPTTHAALRAALHRGLEVFVEGNAAGVEGFAATDL